jgi:restriction system protein
MRWRLHFCSIGPPTPSHRCSMKDLPSTPWKVTGSHDTFSLAWANTPWYTDSMVTHQGKPNAEGEKVRVQSSDTISLNVTASSTILYDIRKPLLAITLKAILDFGGDTDHGLLVRAVAVPWFEIMKMIQRDPVAVHQIDWRKWEEIIAGAYTRAGFDEVILTPRSSDGGKDIIASKRGIGSIRIFDQVKAYKPPHIVSADEVCAMLGVITGHQNVSKGIITTTSEFAPKVADHPAIAPYIPYRLELKPRDVLLEWLAELSNEQPFPQG